jgi:hypothetical protein
MMMNTYKDMSKIQKSLFLDHICREWYFPYIDEIIVAFFDNNGQNVSCSMIVGGIMRRCHCAQETNRRGGGINEVGSIICKFVPSEMYVNFVVWTINYDLLRCDVTVHDDKPGFATSITCSTHI